MRQVFADAINGEMPPSVPFGSRLGQLPSQMMENDPKMMVERVSARFSQGYTDMLQISTCKPYGRLMPMRSTRRPAPRSGLRASPKLDSILVICAPEQNINSARRSASRRAGLHATVAA